MNRQHADIVHQQLSGAHIHAVCRGARAAKVVCHRLERAMELPLPAIRGLNLYRDITFLRQVGGRLALQVVDWSGMCEDAWQGTKTQHLLQDGSSPALGSIAKRYWNRAGHSDAHRAVAAEQIWSCRSREARRGTPKTPEYREFCRTYWQICGKFTNSVPKFRNLSRRQRSKPSLSRKARKAPCNPRRFARIAACDNEKLSARTQQPWLHLAPSSLCPFLG